MTENFKLSTSKSWKSLLLPLLCLSGLFQILWLPLGCGLPKEKNFGVAEIDTSLYAKYIVKGPDTNVYPKHQWCTSQRFPLDKYGLQFAFDGDQSTWWCSQTGLNFGEGVKLEFDELEVSNVVIDIASDVAAARVNMVRVTINDSLYGSFPSGAKIRVNGKLRSLKIIAADAEGLNEVRLPVDPDSGSARKTAYQVLKTRYNSRSFGIAEITLFDMTDQKIPLQAIPYRNAHVIAGHVYWPPDRFNLFDGNPGSSIHWFEANGAGKLLLNFDNYAPVTRLRIVSGCHDFADLPAITEMSIEISGKQNHKFMLQTGDNIIDLPDPMVAKHFTFEMHSFEKGFSNGALSELYLWDGAKWYSIIPDSMFERLQTLKDTVQHTPLRFILDNRVEYSTRIIELIADTFNFPSYEYISPQYMKESENWDYEVLFRSNLTFEFSCTKNMVKYGSTPSGRKMQHDLSGYWRIVSRSSNKVVLHIQGWERIRTANNDLPATFERKQISRQVSIEGNYLMMGDGLGKMRVSY